MDISFIIPVFNTAAAKLERCFQSVQAVKVSYECIIVDDGSELPTEDFCRKFAASDKRFRYIRKTNGGVSSARNMGILASMGKYVAFIDSDDEIVPYVYDEQYYANDADIIFTDLLLCDKDFQTEWKAFPGQSGPVTDMDVLNKIVRDGKLNGPVCKLINRDFLLQNHILFDEKMISGEDAVFLMHMMKSRPVMYYWNKVSYHYYREAKTGTGRLQNHAEILVDNAIRMYHEMLSLIDGKRLENAAELHMEETSNRLCLYATQRFVKNIFQLAAELLENGKYCGAIKDKIRRAINEIVQENQNEASHQNEALHHNEAKFYFKNFRFRTRLEISIILNDHLFCLRVIELIRRIYLFTKHVMHKY